MSLAEIRQSASHVWGALEPYKHELDFASVLVLLGVFLSWIPHITACVVLLVWIVRLYETKTVQGWLTRRKPKEDV